jgi:hypothetical protein
MAVSSAPRAKRGEGERADRTDERADSRGHQPFGLFLLRPTFQGQAGPRRWLRTRKSPRWGPREDDGFGQCDKEKSELVGRRTRAQRVSRPLSHHRPSLHELWGT